ncbi:hypothetical protein COV16_03435 [Candidatus Woesearchaeota archaeon CG10_big_fil_rev_8_21_14_0_10_34_8]|nr:MAG: hypothetical protein COV16_03435 [Candidatus Woesearchaeota archaeon CG10_big_fil_rev_8_21_14_0_10_34_8]
MGSAKESKEKALEKLARGDKPLDKEAKDKSSKNLKHNSLQHDSSIGIPLLDALVQAIKKDQKENEETLEEITDEIIEIEEKDTKKDAAAALADRIKQLYANEITQQAYSNQMQSSYNSNSRYANANSVMSNAKMYGAYIQADEKANTSSEAQNSGTERLKDENSKAYKLSGGSKYQSNTMLDVRGRLHSWWEEARVLNIDADGKIEFNNGLHYQGLS